MTRQFLSLTRACDNANTNDRDHRVGKMKKTALFASIAALFIGGFAAAEARAQGVTWEDIANDDKTTGDVLSYGMGLKAQRFSTLEKINASNVGTLQPAWSFSFGGEK